MASIYARGNVLWIKYKDEHGKPACRSSGYRVGQEAVARELASEVEEQAALKRAANGNALAAQSANTNAPTQSGDPVEPEPKAPAAPITNVRLVPLAATEMKQNAPAASTERIGPEAAPGALTVADYIEQWIKMRSHVETWKDEAGRLRLHVVPLIGHMAIADVRPKHIRDLINAIKRKTSVAPKCKDKPLAPRTVRLIFARCGSCSRAPSSTSTSLRARSSLRPVFCRRTSTKIRRGDRPPFSSARSWWPSSRTLASRSTTA